MKQAKRAHRLAATEKLLKKFSELLNGESGRPDDGMQSAALEIVVVVRHGHRAAVDPVTAVLASEAKPRVFQCAAYVLRRARREPRHEGMET